MRPCRARVILASALAILVAGCQDYNFNPVGHCLIQTGTKRFTLASISSADVLFVVDDSGSMQGEQEALAQNFGAFVANIDQTNVERAAAGLEPIDFHLAVTSTSVFWNYQTSNTCRNDCPGAAGQLVCCGATGPVRYPRACSGPTDGSCPANTACRTNCGTPPAYVATGAARLEGAFYCCAADGTYPAGTANELIPCSRQGATCGTMERHHNFPTGCVPGASAGMNHRPQPAGDFISWSAGATPNPRVLHFDKELYTQGLNRQGFTRQELVSFFASTGAAPGNVVVGTCGSGQEQALAAARLAIEKARDGRQTDTYARTGPAGGKAAVTPTPADWLAPDGSRKLVVVFVGDEDDCSAGNDPSSGVMWEVADVDWDGPGSDSCSRDGSKATPQGGKLVGVETFADFLVNLGRPVAAAFILPAAQPSCTLQTCTTTSLCCPPLTSCPAPNVGGQGRGVRLLATARALADRGIEVVAGSICDNQFNTLLDEIAEIVKSPEGLELPTQPAATEVTLLRIANATGQTRKLCSRPAPGGLSLTAASDAIDPETGRRYDWWFTDSSFTGDQRAASVPISRQVFINPKGACIANPGETYSADYVGRVPEGGCFGTTGDPPAKMQADADEMCRSTLGGSAEAWTCYGGDLSQSTCGVPSDLSPGTCICGSRAQNRCL